MEPRNEEILSSSVKLLRMRIPNQLNRFSKVTSVIAPTTILLTVLMRIMSGLQSNMKPVNRKVLSLLILKTNSVQALFVNRLRVKKSKKLKLTHMLTFWVWTICSVFCLNEDYIKNQATTLAEIYSNQLSLEIVGEMLLLKMRRTSNFQLRQRIF